MIDNVLYHMYALETSALAEWRLLQSGQEPLCQENNLPVPFAYEIQHLAADSSILP